MPVLNANKTRSEGLWTCPPDAERKFIPPHGERKFIPTCEVIDIVIVGVHGDIDDHLPVSCHLVILVYPLAVECDHGTYCLLDCFVRYRNRCLVLRPMFQVSVSSVMNFRSVYSDVSGIVLMGSNKYPV
ncbi:uncharacterized protein [Dysidea avara]|uniref:uncharacterized protein n=1 Tax=Dysidea avara TaxID=196820 RepID=UPI00331B8006